MSTAVLSPMTSMNQTLSAPAGGFAVSTAWSIPKDAPSPMPKTTSAPPEIRVSVTRLPPAASA